MPKLGQLGRIVDSIHDIRDKGAQPRGQRLQHVARRTHLFDFALDKMYLDIDHAPQFLQSMNSRYPEDNLPQLVEYPIEMRERRVPPRVDNFESEAAFLESLKDYELWLKYQANKLLTTNYSSLEEVVEQRQILDYADAGNTKAHLAAKPTTMVHDLHNMGKDREYREVDREFGFQYTTQLMQAKARKPTPVHKRAMSGKGEIMYIDSQDFVKFLDDLTITQFEQLGNHYICCTCWMYCDLSQKLQHQRYLHICPEPDAITDKYSFLHYAKIFNKYHATTGLVHTFQPYNPVSINRIMLVQPTNEKGMRGIKMKRSALEKKMFVDSIKGFPPCLQDPLIPLDMVPFNDQTLIEMPKHDPYKLQFGWQTIKRRGRCQSLQKAFHPDELGQLGQILREASDAIQALDQSMHQLRLMIGAVGQITNLKATKSITQQDLEFQFRNQQDRGKTGRKRKTKQSKMVREQPVESSMNLESIESMNLQDIARAAIESITSNASDTGDQMTHDVSRPCSSQSRMSSDFNRFNQALTELLNKPQPQNKIAYQKPKLPAKRQKVQQQMHVDQNVIEQLHNQMLQYLEMSD